MPRETASKSITMRMTPAVEEMLGQLKEWTGLSATEIMGAGIRLLHAKFISEFQPGKSGAIDARNTMERLGEAARAKRETK